MMHDCRWSAHPSMCLELSDQVYQSICRAPHGNIVGEKNGVDGLVTKHPEVPPQAAQKRDSAGGALDEDRFGQLDKLLNAAGMYTAFLAEQLARMANGNTAKERPSTAAAPPAVVGSKRKLPQTQSLPGLGEDAQVPACLTGSTCSVHPLSGNVSGLSNGTLPPQEQQRPVVEHHHIDELRLTRGACLTGTAGAGAAHGGGIAAVPAEGHPVDGLAVSQRRQRHPG